MSFSRQSLLIRSYIPMLKQLSASWACVVFSAANIFARSIGSTNWRRAQWRSRSHFLPDRRFSTPAIHSNNCFITGPSGNSLAASIALACSGGRSVNRGGIYLFFLPDSLRVVLSLSIYHCSQELQPSSHNSVFHLAGSPKSVFVLFSEKAKASPRLPP